MGGDVWPTGETVCKQSLQHNVLQAAGEKCTLWAKTTDKEGGGSACTGSANRSGIVPVRKGGRTKAGADRGLPDAPLTVAAPSVLLLPG